MPGCQGASSVGFLGRGVPLSLSLCLSLLSSLSSVFSFCLCCLCPLTLVLTQCRIAQVQD